MAFPQVFPTLLSYCFLFRSRRWLSALFRMMPLLLLLPLLFVLIIAAASEGGLTNIRMEMGEGKGRF
jgi:hypothetical protein